MDRTKLALAVCVAALAGVVGWQQFSKPAVAPPAPLQIERPSAPKTPAAAPAAAPASAPAVVPAPDSGPAPKKPVAKRRDVRPTPPAATNASRGDAVPPAPVAVASTPAPAPAPVSGAEEYEAMAIARLQQGDYREARELFETALRNGGKATFAIVHDHSKGNFEKDPKASCVGELILSPDEISFVGAGAGDSHHFAASWAEVVDAGSNRFFGSGMGGFHVAIKPEGKYKNFNLAPKSKDKQESKLIVDLLNANTRRQDRGK